MIIFAIIILIIVIFIRRSNIRSVKLVQKRQIFSGQKKGSISCEVSNKIKLKISDLINDALEMWKRSKAGDVTMWRKRRRGQGCENLWQWKKIKKRKDKEGWTDCTCKNKDKEGWTDCTCKNKDIEGWTDWTCKNKDKEGWTDWTCKNKDKEGWTD